jgi:iron complex outermembrane receptor protein
VIAVRLPLTILASFALLCAAGFSSIASAQTAAAGVISGTVIGLDTRTAVPNAIVAVEGTTLKEVANAGGWFRIENVPAGRVVLRAEAPGYLELRTQSVRVEAGETTSVTVELPATPNFMDRLQVTATKTELSIGEVPGQATVVDRTTFQQRGDQTLAQAIAHTTGAVVSTQLGIFDSVTLRGMPRGDPEFTNTLLLVDGVPQTLSNNGARLVTLPIQDAGAIEIVRGPNSALYGRTAIGGAVNVRTADPTATHTADFDLSGGGFGAAIGGARASGPVKSWGGYYAAISGAHDNGYYVNRVSDNYDTGHMSLFGKLAFAPDAKGFGNVSVNYVRSNNSTPTNEPIIDGRLLNELDPGSFPRFTNLNLPGPNYKQRETRLTLNYTRALTPNFKLIEVFGYRDVRHEFVEDGDFIGSPYDLEAKTVSQFPFSQRTDENIVYQELRVEYSPQFGRLQDQFIAGGSYEYDSGSTASDFIYTDPDLFGWTQSYVEPVIPAEDTWQHDLTSRRYHLGVSALFAQYVVEPFSRLVLLAGGRYDRLDMDNTVDDGPESDVAFDAFSPKLSATVRLLRPGRPDNTTLNAYAVYSHAFLPPRRPSSLIPSDVALNLEPEDIDNYEGGLKGTAFNRRLAFSGGYFWMKESGVVLTTRQGPFFIPTNSGEQRYEGVEAEGSWVFTDKVTGYLNVALYHNRFGDFVIQSEEGDEVLTGNRLPISPSHVVNLGALIKPRPDLDVTFDVKRTGSMEANRENTFEIEGSTLVDAAVTWKHRQFRVTLSAHNMFDNDYYTLSDGDTADPGRPRQVLLTVGVAIK